MYYSRFGLSENPFGATPNPRYLYLSRGHREAMDHLVYGIRERKGFIMITGGVGTGKTTLLRSLLAEADETLKTALLLNPFLSEEDLLPAVCAEFGVKGPEGGGKREWLAALYDFLLKNHAEGRIAVLLLDEAQNLSREVLEEARILSNLETEKEKLLQIVLTGQEELVRLLARPELRQLNERVVVRYHLGPLSGEDVRAYVQHRMGVAGNRGPVPFSRDAWKALSAVSGGIPRRINAVCDRAFLAAYSRNLDRVGGELIREAAREVGAAGAGPEAAPRPRRSGYLLAAGLALALSAGAAAGFLAGFKKSLPAAIPARAATPASAGNQAAPPAPAAASRAAVEAPASPVFPARAKTGPAALAPWVLGNAESLDLLYRTARMPGGASRAGLFSFRLDVSRARRFVMPFRAALTGEDAFAVVTGVTASGFSVMDRSGKTEDLPTATLAGSWTGSLLWLAPENLMTFGPEAGRAQGRVKAVSFLQEWLTAAGYPVRPDGIYGPKTREAVTRLQNEFGISPDGAAGFETVRVLYQLGGMGRP